MTKEELLEIAKPILFNTAMTQAILDGRKGKTRRLIKPQPPEKTQFAGIVKNCENKRMLGSGIFSYGDGTAEYLKSAYLPGDILYVRETWQHCYEMDGNDQIIEDTGRYVYAASPEDVPNFTHWIKPDGTYRDYMPWRPSIHMPKSAARIFLRVTGVRAERLLSPFYESGNAVVKTIASEGIVLPEKCQNCLQSFENPCCINAFDDTECYRLDAVRTSFAQLWNGTVAESEWSVYGWTANPWVWVYGFERIVPDPDTQP